MTARLMILKIVESPLARARSYKTSREAIGSLNDPKEKPRTTVCAAENESFPG
jgi:hypothetical protein